MRTKAQIAATKRFGQFTYALSPAQKRERKPEENGGRCLKAMDHAAEKLVKDTEDHWEL